MKNFLSKLLFIVMFPVAVTGQCLHPDYDALMALYNATNGPEWADNTGWAAGAAGLDCDPCNDWFGIQCNQVGRVTAISVYGDNNFVGFLPPELGDLSELQSLYISQNPGLGGEIPSEIANLSNLKQLYLSTCAFSGPIPASLANLDQLEILSLLQNNLTGEVPNWLTNLVNLKILHLNNNELTGEIPSQLSDLTQLERLWLHFNELSGTIPPTLGELSNLVELDLRGNNLSGEIPAELGDLIDLKRLIISKNKLTGCLPPELANLGQLQILFANFNDLSGCFPASYDQFCDILYDFSDNPNLPDNGNFAAFCDGEIGFPCVETNFEKINGNDPCVYELLIELTYTGGECWQVCELHPDGSKEILASVEGDASVTVGPFTQNESHTIGVESCDPPLCQGFGFQLVFPAAPVPVECNEENCLEATVTNVQCRTNNNPFPEDDSWYFDLYVTGGSPASYWISNFPANPAGPYDKLKPMEMGYVNNFPGGVFELVLTDYFDPQCQTTVSIPLPSCYGDDPKPGRGTIQVYPNPAQEFLYLTPGTALLDFDARTPWRILNASGQQVREGRLAPGKSFAAIDLRSLQPGLYFVAVDLPGEKLITSFVRTP